MVKEGSTSIAASPDSALAALISNKDWAATPLGRFDDWPSALQNTVSIILSAPLPMILFWGADQIAIYNDAYAALIGARHPAALGGKARDKWGHIWDKVGPILTQVRETGAPFFLRDGVFPVTESATGQALYDIAFSAVHPIDGTCGGVLCIVFEVTDRVQAIDTANAERARLAMMFEQAPGVMAWLREPGHVFEFANRAFQHLVQGRAVIGGGIADAVPELVEQGFVGLLDQVAATRRPYAGQSMPIRLDSASGGEGSRLLDLILQPVVNANGDLTAIFIEGSDVTDRVRAEEQLVLSENTLRLATDMAEIGTWDLNVKNGDLEWSDRAKAMFGISPDQPCTMDDFYAGLHPEDLEATSRAFAAALDPAQRASYDVEYRTIGKEDGITRWVAAKGRGLFDGDGRCVRAIGTVLDITRRKLAQEELRESEARFRTLADSAPALIWMCDANGALVFANRWHEETFGRPVAELMGAGWQDIIHPEDERSFTADFDRAFMARKAFSRDVRVIDSRGVTRWLHSEARPREEDQKFVGYVGCDVDITDVHLASEILERGILERTQELAAANRQLSAQIEERERVEATLRQMQRLEAIGQLTSGVAHDFNNLLTVILGNVDLVARAAADAHMDERTRQRLGYMRTAAERGATLTAQLLAFSRRQRLEARPIDLNDSVAGMRDLLQSSMGGSVRLDTYLRPDLWPALVDPTQIELIILNLAINARDAMDVGGSLTVSTDNITLGEPERPEEPPPGDYVLIAVTDTGSGMTPDVRDRAFEPFFTTKPIGKGSGLGLPQVYGFAKQSGGGVAIETAPGVGTSVRVYLPRAEERRRFPRRPEQQRPHPSGSAGGRRILVVDDDPPVREITATMLRTMGADVLEAGSAGAALELLEGHSNVDILVIDFAMPGMNGAELAAICQKRWPHVPVLFVTGYADLSAIASVSEKRIVQKPFRGGELQRKLGLLLAQLPSPDHSSSG